MTNGICTNENLSSKIRHKTLWDFEIQTYQPIQGRKPEQVLINKYKRTWHQMDFTIPVDNWGKMKKTKQKKDKYSDLAREPNKLYNMKVTGVLDGEAPVKLELWGIRSTPSLLLLPDPLLPGVGCSYGSYRTVWHSNRVKTNGIINWIVWNRTVWSFMHK